MPSVCMNTYNVACTVIVGVGKLGIATVKSYHI